MNAEHLKENCDNNTTDMERMGKVNVTGDSAIAPIVDDMKCRRKRASKFVYPEPVHIQIMVGCSSSPRREYCDTTDGLAKKEGKAGSPVVSQARKRCPKEVRKSLRLSFGDTSNPTTSSSATPADNTFPQSEENEPQLDIISTTLSSIKPQISRLQEKPSSDNKLLAEQHFVSNFEFKGFTTGKGSAIHISETALSKARQIFNSTDTGEESGEFYFHF